MVSEVHANARIQSSRISGPPQATSGDPSLHYVDTNSSQIKAKKTFQHPPSRSPRKRVAFHETVRCLPIANLADMSLQDRRDVWYDAAESAELVANMKNAVIAMKRRQPEYVEHSYRGLEHLVSSRTVHERTEEQQHSVRAVLAAQAIGDSSCVAHISSQFTGAASQRALQYGANDAADATYIYSLSP